MDLPPSPGASRTSQQSNDDVTQSIERTISRTSTAMTRKSILWKLYLSHTISTWNARTFEFGAVIFLATIFPGTLFYASCYALFRSAAAAILSSWVGGLVDRTYRLKAVRQSIVWQRLSVAASCLLLFGMLRQNENNGTTISLFAFSVGFACLEKLGFVANTVSIERDWVIVVSDSLGVERQELNSAMRRIDLVCKLIAPLCISGVEAYSTKIAIWVVFGQNALSVIFEYFAIAHVFSAIPELSHGKGEEATVMKTNAENRQTKVEEQDEATASPKASGRRNKIMGGLTPWRSYVSNPAFLASFSLSLLYLTVLSFGSQLTTYLLTVGFTSIHISLMRLVAVILELAATCIAPVLMRKIGAVRSGLWFINEQLLSVTLAIGLFSTMNTQTRLAGGLLVIGVVLSRTGLWGFDLCVQYLVQEDAPEASRGSFSATEAALQNFFELLSFATTMIFYEPEQFSVPIYISAGAIAISATCFAGFVRRKRGHLLHTSRCLRREGRIKYNVLPTIDEEELEEL